MEVRIIPCLLLSEGRLVKTVQFRQPRYIGDPVNTVRIFNELEVDEMCFLDISASTQQREPDYDLLQQLSDECFMPLSYGGGIHSVAQAQQLFRSGFEKIVINTAALENPGLITALSARFGSQSIVLSVDVNRNLFGQYSVRQARGDKKDPFAWAAEMQEAGAGEILVTSVKQEGTWKGFDLPLVKKMTETVDIPVIAHGGGGTVAHLREVIETGKVNAVALGSMLLFQQKDKGVLVNFPKEKIAQALTGTI
jgi:imidazole glycerol-phosphate synthase subunit HisF